MKGVTKEAIKWAYKLLLNREPENEQVYAHHGQASDLMHLTETLLRSPEFHRVYSKLFATFIFPQEFGPRIIELIKSFSYHPTLITDTHFISSFGVITFYDNLPFRRTKEDINESLLLLPVPADGWLTSTIEYYSVLDSLDRARQHYNFIELGAGWGPWSSLAGCLARHKGLSCNIVACEGSTGRFELLKRHLKSNNLLDNTKLFDGVVSVNHEKLYFSNSSLDDMDAHIVDILNNSESCQTVQGFTLEELMDGLPFVDLVHFDIQGYEYDIIKDSIHLLNSRVKNIFIGTHSRIIEGKCIEILHNNHWQLKIEEPAFLQRGNALHVGEERLIKDGAQYWINTKI